MALFRTRSSGVANLGSYGKSRLPQHFAEPYPRGRFARGHNEVPIAGRKRLPWNGVVVSRAGWFGQFTIREPHRPHVGEQMQHDIEHGNVDPPPLPCAFPVEKSR